MSIDKNYCEDAGQVETLANHLKDCNTSITTAEAFTNWQITRLAAIIGILKKDYNCTFATKQIRGEGKKWCVAYTCTSPEAISVAASVQEAKRTKRETSSALKEKINTLKLTVKIAREVKKFETEKQKEEKAKARAEKRQAIADKTVKNVKQMAANAPPRARNKSNLIEKGVA